jgi:hypothetical protein
VEDSNNHNVVFDKRMTSIVKGVAIVFMLLLHCYEIGNYDVELNLEHSLFSSCYHVFKICIGIFAFLVGYGYAFSQAKDLKYSIKHIEKLLIPFGYILFVFTWPLCFNEVINPDLVMLVYNLFGISSYFNYFSWFVYFFIFAMIVMPFVARFIVHRPVQNAIISIVIAYLLSVAVHEIPSLLNSFGFTVSDIVDNQPLLALFNCLMMTPIMILGFLFAYQGYYEKIKIHRVSRFWIVIICVLAIIVVLTLRYFRSAVFAFQLDFFYAPVVIGAIAVFFNALRCMPVRVMLIKMGEVSVYMWFFHALFFTKAVRWFYQPAITIFNDINLVALWTIILTFFASWLIKTIVDNLTVRLITTN